MARLWHPVMSLALVMRELMTEPEPWLDDDEKALFANLHNFAAPHHLVVLAHQPSKEDKGVRGCQMMTQQGLSRLTHSFPVDASTFSHF